MYGSVKWGIQNGWVLPSDETFSVVYIPRAILIWLLMCFFKINLKSWYSLNSPHLEGHHLVIQVGLVNSNGSFRRRFWNFLQQLPLSYREETNKKLMKQNVGQLSVKNSKLFHEFRWMHHLNTYTYIGQMDQDGYYAGLCHFLFNFGC